MNTHYAVLAFSGDPANEHKDEDLRGRAPHLELIASGSEDFCWEAAIRWTETHPLAIWQTVEVLARDIARVNPRDRRILTIPEEQSS